MSDPTLLQFPHLAFKTLILPFPLDILLYLLWLYKPSFAKPLSGYSRRINIPPFTCSSPRHCPLDNFVGHSRCLCDFQNSPIKLFWDWWLLHQLSCPTPRKICLSVSIWDQPKVSNFLSIERSGVLSSAVNGINDHLPGVAHSFRQLLRTPYPLHLALR
jgi:hypothetical protein